MGQTRRARNREGRAVRLRAEDRRAGRGRLLRARGARPGCHSRRRPHGRGHHGEHPHRTQRARPTPGKGAPGDPRCSWRGLSSRARVREAERRASPARRAFLRQPAERRSRVASPEGPTGERVPPAQPVVPWGSLGPGSTVRLALGVARVPSRCGTSREPGHEGGRRIEGRLRVLRTLAAGPAHHRL